MSNSLITFLKPYFVIFSYSYFMIRLTTLIEQIWIQDTPFLCSEKIKLSSMNFGAFMQV